MKRNLIGIIAVALMIGVLDTGCSKQQYSLPDESQQFGQTVTYNNKADIVLMVDNSSSMLQYQSKLAAQVPAMINSLNALGMDYRIVVVTTDMRTNGSGGMFVGSPKILTRSTANLASVLSARVNQGETGSDLERGLDSIRSVLQTSYLSNEGAGFFRDDALLAVIALSNEDDYSSGSVADYEAFFDTLKPKFKGTTQAWMVNFIGVPNLASSCSTTLDSTYKEPGSRWIELANYSGGKVEAICDTSLAAAVDNVRKRIVEVLTDYHLSRKPKVETIVVKINGKTIPQSMTNGWEYIPNGYIVRFHGTAVPGATDSISVDFTPAEAL